MQETIKVPVWHLSSLLPAIINSCIEHAFMTASQPVLHMQVRHEIATENGKLQHALQQQHAEMTGLMERANRFEQQSLAAQQELEAMRLQMHQQDTWRTELDLMNVPQAPDRIECPPLAAPRVRGYHMCQRSLFDSNWYI
jgi:predicted nuclease with TOPRIM domain